MLTQAECSPTGFHRTYDACSNSKAIAKAATESGGKKRYFLTTDHAFGAALQRDMTKFLSEAGGEIGGAVKMPLGSALHQSLFLMQGRAAATEVILIAAGDADFDKTVKQAAEFGITEQVKGISGSAVFVQDVHSSGAETAQGRFLPNPSAGT